MARVLVVEDDPDIRELVSLRLRAAGHRTVAVDDGESALALVDAHGGPEVAVLDVGLPGLDGFATLQELRARPGLHDVPAVFLTARVHEADVERGRALGATYLTKPFIASALIATVERLARERAVVAADGW
ncbi:response regulator transcription factor [Vallicoccus soli]|uniref:Response regulator n=1 Tax=Vallicoccus soli TaxID=2339232 RepID=A0A3A3Z4K6_9ACTN|nr:response regulator [Vallicoccus soli]RJK95477.1 response regulator [Vallicoccus soli]